MGKAVSNLCIRKIKHRFQLHHRMPPGQTTIPRCRVRIPTGLRKAIYNQRLVENGRTCDPTSEFGKLQHRPGVHENTWEQLAAMIHEWKPRHEPTTLANMGRTAQVKGFTGGTLLIMGLSDETDFQKIVDAIEIENRSNFNFSWDWSNSVLTVTIQPKARPANP